MCFSKQTVVSRLGRSWKLHGGYTTLWCDPTSSKMLSVPALNARRDKVQWWWVLRSETEKRVRWVSFANSRKKKKWCFYLLAFFYVTISCDYKPELTTLVDTELLCFAQLRLTRWQGSIGGFEFKEVCRVPVLPGLHSQYSSRWYNWRIPEGDSSDSCEVASLGWDKLFFRLPWLYWLRLQFSFSIPGT